MRTLLAIAQRIHRFSTVMPASKVIPCLLVLCFSLTSSLPAATVRYDAASGNWIDPTWAGGVGTNPPLDGDDVQIGNGSIATAVAEVTVNTDLSPDSFPTILLGQNAGGDGTLNIDPGGVLTTTTLTVGSTSNGTLNMNGGTLVADNIFVALGGPGILNLNGNTLSVSNNLTFGTGAATLNRAGGSLIVPNQLEVQGAGNTFSADASDTIGGTLRVDSSGTVDLNGIVGYSVPTTLQLGGGTPAFLARTGGGTFDVTNFWVRGGSDITTVAGDQTDHLEVQQTGSTLTLGDNLTISGNAAILSGGILNLDGNDLTATNITFGTGSFTLNRGAGGTLNATNQLEVQGAGNTYVVNTADTIGSTLRVDADGTVDLNGVIGYSVPTTLQLGGGTPANLDRTGGGTLDVANLWVRGGSTISTVPGDAVSNQVEVLQQATLSVLGNLSPAILDVTDSSTLNIASGVTVSTGDVTIGSLGASPYSKINLGTAAGTATIAGGTGPEDFFVDQSGELRGWGTVSLTGELFIVGRVVADGFGLGGNDLDLSSFTSYNTGTTGRENLVGEDHGLYAVNQGRLIMPNVSVGAGSGVTVRMGETNSDPDEIDMINSSQFDFAEVVNAGAIGGQLLAIDHPDVEDRLIKPLAVWDFTAEDGLAFTTVDIQIRYDDLLASLEGIDENDLKLFHFEDEDWVDITTGIDTVNKILFGGGVTSFSQFAIATDIAPPVPEPSSLLLLGSLALGLLRQGRRNRRTKHLNVE